MASAVFRNSATGSSPTARDQRRSMSAKMRSAAARAEPDDLRASILGVGNALGVAETFEVGDHLADRLLCHSRAPGQLSQPCAIALDEAKDAAVPGADVRVALVA